MSTTFPHTRRTRLGYNADEVDRFLSTARASYDTRGGRAPVSAADIRQTAFSMQRGGYATSVVDAALERLEDAFAARERAAVVKERGERAWFASTRTLAKEIIARVSRPRRHRFDRVGVLATGYSTKDVDRFCDRVRAFFESGGELAVDEVRGAGFRPGRGGYREAQVDVLLDAVVEVMLAVKE